MQGLSPAQIAHLPIPAPELHTLLDNAKHTNAAGVSPGGAVIWFYRLFARISSNHIRQRILSSYSLKDFNRS